MKNDKLKFKNKSQYILSFTLSFFILIFTFSINAYAAQSTFTTSLTTTGVSSDPPPKPTNFTTTAVSDTQIDLSWTASVAGFYPISGYRIFKGLVFLATTTAITYSDTGLTPETAYGYTVEAFDTLLQFSGRTATSTATTQATPVSTPAPSAGSSGSSSDSRNQSGLIISDLDIIAGADEASLIFKTNQEAKVKVEWGLTPDFEAGSLQSFFYSIDHELLISGLEPSTKYYVRITATNSLGVSVSTDSTFTTVAPVFEEQISNPADFLAIPTKEAIDLSWTNPDDSRFSEVVVVRSDTFFPRDQFDGLPVYQGPGENYLDTGVVVGQDYYYAIFAKTFDGKYSSGALAKARIARPGEVIAPVSADPFANIPMSANVHPLINSLTLSDFEFIQEGRQLLTEDNTIAIDGGLNLTIRLKYEKVPEILKTVAFTLSDPDDPSKVFPFLLRINNDKTYYEATIGALGRSGRYSMSVVILDYQNQGLKRLNGTLAALVFSAFPFSLDKNIDPMGLVSLILLIILLLIIIMALRRKHIDQVKAFRKNTPIYNPDNLFPTPVVVDRQLNTPPALSGFMAGKSAFSFLGKNIFIIALVFVSTFILYIRGADAAVFNPQINYQGKLTDAANAAVADGNYSIRFKLYTALTGGSPVWTETWCNTSDCAGTGAGTDDRITITNGLFSTMLGSTTAFGNLDFNQPLYLSVEVGGSGATASWDGEMSPRKILGAVPAAFYAGTSTVAVSANALSGLNSEQFLRSDAQNATSSATTFLNVLQSGAGKIAEFLGTASQSVLSLLSSGKVGIGTTTPYAKLSISALSGETNPAVFAISSTTAANATSTLFVVGSNGKVGIGTSDPKLSLDVNGYGTAQTNGSGIGIKSNATGNGGLEIYNSFSASTNSSAAVTLYNGSGGGTGSLALTMANGWNTNTTFGEYNYESGIISGNGINLILKSGSTKNIIFGTNVTERARISSSGRFGIGTTSPWGILSVNGTSTQSSFIPLFVVASSTGTATSTAFIIDSNGKTGIGTSSPYSQLGVAGLAAASYFNADDANATSTFAGGLNVLAINQTGTASSTFANGIQLSAGCFQMADGSCVGGSTGSGTVSASTLQGQLPFYDAVGTTLTATSSIFLAQSGRFGVGTTTPFGRFSVNGLAGGATPLFVVGSSTAAFSTSTAFIIDQNGKVGIGTNNPGSQLEVSGDVSLSQGGARTFKINTSASGNGNALYVQAGKGLQSGFTGGNLYLDGGSYGTGGPVSDNIQGNVFLASQNAGDISGSVTGGLVGIGTTTPNQKLSIFSNANDTAIELSGLSGSNYKWVMGLDYSDGGKFKIASSSFLGTNDRLAIDGNGNVGIGTSSPWATLSVEGTSTLGNSAWAGYFNATSTTIASTFPYASTTALTVSGNATVGSITSNGNISIPFSSSLILGPATGLSINPTIGGTVDFVNLQGGTPLSIDLSTNRVTLSSATIGSLTGPLQALSGVVSASSTLSVAYGGTGLSTKPSYGQLLLGNASNGYTLSATSSLGFLASTTIGSLTTNYLPKWGGSTFSNSLLYDSGTNIGIASSTPWGLFSVNGSAGGSVPLLVVSSSTAAFATSTAFIIDQNGKVGVGTSSPYAQLGVSGLVAASYFNADSTTATSTFAGKAVFGQNFDGVSLAASSSAVTIRTVNTGGGANSLANGLYIDYSPENSPPFSTSTALQLYGSPGTARNIEGIHNIAKMYYGSKNVIGMVNEFASDYSSNKVWGILNKVEYKSAGDFYGIQNIIDVDYGSELGSISNSYGLYNDIPNIYAGNSNTSNVYGTYSIGRTYSSGTKKFYGNYVSSGSDSSGGTQYGFYADLTNGTATKYPAILLGGNVGIGTTTPYWNLQIASSSKTRLALSDMSAGTDLKHWLLSSMGGNFYIGTSSDSYATSTIAEALTITSNGNFGLGTSSPSSVLSVSGDTLFGNSSTSRITLNGGIFAWANAGTTTILDNIRGAWSIATSTDSNAQPIITIQTSAGNLASTTINGGLTVGNGSLEYDYSSGLTTISGLQTTGGMSFDSDLGAITWINMPVTSAIPLGTPTSYTASIQDNPLLTIYALSNGTGGIVATSTAVGIGTTTPLAMLDIFAGSTTSFTTGFTNNYDALSITNQATSSTASIIKTGLNINSTGSWSGTGASNIGLYVSSVTGGTNNYDAIFNGGGNVGIGSTSPWANLSVNATSTLQATPLFAVSSSTSGYPTAFIIDQNGKVGIGTSTPGTDLAVAGVTSAGAFNAFSPNATSTFAGGIQLTAGCFMLSTGICAGTGTADTAGTVGQIQFASNSNTLNADSNLYWDNTNKRLGLGTTTPNARLTVLSENSPQFRLGYDATTTLTASIGSNGATTLAIGGVVGGLTITNPQPATVDSGTGTAAPISLNVTGATGGNSNDTNIGTGGIGGGLQLLGGVGGTASLSTFTANGGAGGVVTIVGGTGGAGTTVDVDLLTRLGGIGGAMTLNGGAGGNTTGGGAGSSNTAGAGGIMTLKGGAGGNASGATSNTGGAGGSLYLSGGAGGTGSTANGTAGDLYLGFDSSNLLGNVYLGNKGGTFVSSSGNFGIGTTTPWGKVSVAALSSNTAPLFTLSTTTSGNATSTAFIIDQNGNVGIGTSSPSSVLSVSGDTLFGNSSTSRITLNGGIFAWANAGTTTILDNIRGAWSIATSTDSSAQPIITIQTSAGNLASTTINGGLTVGNGSLEYDYSSGLTSLSGTQMSGGMNFDTDAGAVSWADMPLSSALAYTVESYTANMNGNPLLTIYALSNGAGGIVATSTAVGIGTTTPLAMLDIFAGSTTSFTTGFTNNYDALSITNQATSSTANIIKTGLNINSTGSWSGTGASNIGLYVSSVTGGTNNYDAIFNGGGFVSIGTTTPYTKGLTIWGPDNLSSTRVLDVANSASTSILTAFDDGAVKIGGTTSTTTINGYLDVLGTGDNSTSTIASNLWVQGSLRSTYSYVGDLIFANNFKFVEFQPMNDASSTQGLNLQNQAGTNVLAIDDRGNLNISGDICANNVTCVNKSISTLSENLSALASSTELLQNGVSTLGSTATTTASSVQSLADAIVALGLRVDTLEISNSSLVSSVSSALASSTEFAGAIASSTERSLASSTPFVTVIAEAVKNIIQSTNDWVVERFTAKIAFVNRVEAETVAISRGMEIIDQSTGATWCVTIKNGDWSKVLGTCVAVASTTPVIQTTIVTPDNTTTTTIVPITTPASVITETTTVPVSNGSTSTASTTETGSDISSTTIPILASTSTTASTVITAPVATSTTSSIVTETATTTSVVSNPPTTTTVTESPSTSGSMTTGESSGESIPAVVTEPTSTSSGSESESAPTTTAPVSTDTTSTAPVPTETTPTATATTNEAVTAPAQTETAPAPADGGN